MEHVRKVTLWFQIELQLVSVRSHIWQKCFCCDLWNVMNEVPFFHVCIHMCLSALYCMFLGLVAFIAKHKALQFYSNKFRRGVKVFFNMLSLKTCPTVGLGISCFSFACKDYKFFCTDRHNSKHTDHQKCMVVNLVVRFKGISSILIRATFI